MRKVCERSARECSVAVNNDVRLVSLVLFFIPGGGCAEAIWVHGSRGESIILRILLEGLFAEGLFVEGLERAL